jgi:hypothetical protein
MKNAKLILTLVAGAAVALPLSGQDQQPRGRLTLMQRKLAHAQKVLEGMALRDFDLIARHGEELIRLSKQAEWKVLQTPLYELHSNDFRRIAENVVQNAKAKNLDGAALAYVDLTLNCVKCHKHVREVRMARLDLSGPPLLVRAERGRNP